MSNLTSHAGLDSSALQPDAPVAEEDNAAAAVSGIVTSVAGLSRSSTYRCSSQTQLITDVTTTPPYLRQHEFKANSLRDAEALKSRLDLSSYQTSGRAFAPPGPACNFLGQQALKMLRYQWIVADRTARRVVSLPNFSFPATADLPGVADELLGSPAAPCVLPVFLSLPVAWPACLVCSPPAPLAREGRSSSLMVVAHKQRLLV